MREILFRGKTAEGDWTYGYYVHTPKRTGAFGQIVSQADVDRHHILTMKCNIIKEIYPETVGQYTGLTDKNGIKIFEADIVAGAVHWLERMKNGVVVFRDGSFGLLWHRGEVEQFAPFTSLCNVEYEVIGNIHDNPELLKGGE